jgi:hypothetical protein
MVEARPPFQPLVLMKSKTGRKMYLSTSISLMRCSSVLVSTREKDERSCRPLEDGGGLVKAGTALEAICGHSKKVWSPGVTITGP